MRLLRKVRLLSQPVLVLVCLFLVSGCKTNQEKQQLQQEVNRLQQENAQLQQRSQSLEAQQPVSPQPSPVSPQTQSLGAIAFEDIGGVFGEKEIAQLAKLGVFENTTGKFNPQQPITRAKFVRWLVHANNAIWADDSTKTVRLAGGGEATFPDVPPTHPDFRYIQGMTNAGFAVGDDEKNFKPDGVLTREQMIAIKVGLDQGGLDVPTSDYIPAWTDRNQISKRFIPSFQVESWRNKEVNNVERTFGAIKTFRPQAPVTRAEAAVCIWKIGPHSVGAAGKSFKPRTAEDALDERAKQGSPL